MSSTFDNLGNLGDEIHVPIEPDADAFLGRECPVTECEGYFTIKLGTGLSGDNLPCHCPYCGHRAGHEHFWTKDQIEYAKSIAVREIGDALTKDLKKLEFDHKPKGPFGIGLSLTIQPGSRLPIRYYREKTLETHVTCSECTLEYAVFGVFAYCPDCGTHNSLEILRRNLDLVGRQLDLAGRVEDDLKVHLIEDGLENCVSAFDGFGRETCRVRSHLSTDSRKVLSISFQHLPRAAERLQTLFDVDLQGAVDADDWRSLHVDFMRRHLIAHKSGVVDQKHLDETGESSVLLGRRITIRADDVYDLSQRVAHLGETLVGILPRLK